MFQAARIPLLLVVIASSWPLAGETQTPVVDVERLVTEFFDAYNAFDGSHLAYYAEGIVLEDETAGQKIETRVALEELYEQSRQSYEEVEFVIVDRLIDELGRRVAVRGRLVGRALGRDYDVPFSTFLEIEEGKIVHQVDFVDYETLRRQVQPEADEQRP